MKRTVPAADSVQRVSTAFLAVFAVLVGLKLTQDIFAPLLLAVVVGVIFAPLADRLERLGLPRGAVAMTLIVGIFFVAAGLIFFIEPYITAAIDRIPAIRMELRQLMFEYRGLIQGIGEVNREVEEALGGNGEGGATEMPGLTDALILAPLILAQILIFLGGLFFFLLTRNNIYNWMSRNIGSHTDTMVIMERFCSAEQMVSRYFAAVSAINTGLGVSVGLAMMAIGMPGAMVWGIGAALLNFVLYLGPAALAAGLLIAGIVNFDGVMSFVPMAVYLGLNMTEAQFVTPALVGRHVRVNPFMVFVSLVFWLWLWGPIGGIVAIPVTLMLFKLFDILGEHPVGRPA